VKKIPTGGRLLEIAPWTWRKQPLIHYHLSGDKATVRMLYDLGYADARQHHEELARFFSTRPTKKASSSSFSATAGTAGAAAATVAATAAATAPSATATAATNAAAAAADAIKRSNLATAI
jgi:hypothetical protein